MVGVVDWGSATPEVRIVMKDPALGAIVFPGYPDSCFSALFYQLEKGLMAFRQVGKLCWPVIHFRIDIGGVLASPGRLQILVPDSLQVGWLGSGAAG